MQRFGLREHVRRPTSTSNPYKLLQDPEVDCWQRLVRRRQLCIQVKRRFNLKCAKPLSGDSCFINTIENVTGVALALHRPQFWPSHPTHALAITRQTLTSPLLKSPSLKLSILTFRLSLPCSHARTFFFVPSQSTTTATWSDLPTSILYF